MEGIQSLGTVPQNRSQYQLQKIDAKFELHAILISSTLQGGSEDTVDTSLSALYQGLTGTAKSIIDKINELLKAKLPNGVQSLKPEEVTPEATAERIVRGITGLFDGYSRSHPELSTDELISRFISAAKSGVQSGYDDAFHTLQDLGAFEFDGVQSGVEKTKTLIDSKLDTFGADLRKRLAADPEKEAANSASTSLLAQAGGRINLVA